MRQLLDYQANQIEQVLQNHRQPGRVTGGTVTPRWISYQLVPEAGSKVGRITKLSEEIALRLGASGVRISRKGAIIQIEVPREDAKAVGLLQLCRTLPDLPRQSALLGLGEDGSPLVLRLPSPDVAHVLIAGTTGSGKTALARSMLLSLAMYNRLSEIQLVLIDPKGREFAPLASLPHLLKPLVSETHQAIFTLAELAEEMVRRDRQGISEPRLVVLIDEVADLLDQGGNAVSRLLTRLTQRGRSAGIHIIACTQKPLAASIGSLTKSNFPVRLVGSVASPVDAKVAAGIANTGAEQLLGRGDFLLVSKGKTVRFQAAYATPVEMQSIVTRLRREAGGGRHWLSDTAPPAPLAKTGTEGGRLSLRGLKQFFGTQLRLLK
jgi:S-DNA-T family DNA segregation ATPase FtsK/SpoIIIE